MWWLPKSPKLLAFEIFKLIIIHCTWCITHIYSVYALTPTIQCGNFNEELHRDCDDAIFVLQSNQFTCLLMVCNILWLSRLEINRWSCVYRYCGILVKHSYEMHKTYCVHNKLRGWVSFLWLSLNFSCKITEARINHYLFTNGLIVFLLSISI